MNVLSMIVCLADKPADTLNTTLRRRTAVCTVKLGNKASSQSQGPQGADEALCTADTHEIGRLYH